MTAKKTYMLIFLVGMIYVFISFCRNINETQTFISPGETNMESAIEKAFPHKGIIKEVYGRANIIAAPNEIDRIVKDEDGYMMPLDNYDYNTDYPADKLTQLRDVCNEKGIEFAYISYPSKSDSTDTGAIYGIDTNSEAVRNSLLKKIDENGIDILNVRNLMEADGLTGKDIFYKTDHHWNTRAGLYAARAIAQFLCDKGYATYPEYLTDDKFTYENYENCWLGETGRKYSATWVGSLDDFTVIKPAYETSLDYIVPNSFEKSGDFSILMDESLYGTEFDIYDTSLHYTYMSGAGRNTIIKNNNLKDGAKVLFVKDSFSMVVAPFLALGCGELNLWDMRDNEASLYEYIMNNDFDIVVVAYTDFFRNDMYDFF